MAETTEDRKREAATTAAGFIKSGEILGVGTGSTVNFLIELLPQYRHKIDLVVASSLATEQRLCVAGFKPVGLSESGPLTLYIDGADEVNETRQMIKGGGGALTREKILAASASRFVCIVDASKHVELLGRFPVAVEVLEFARSHVAVRLAAMGGLPRLRESFFTDNGHRILDVANLDLVNASEVEMLINNIPGVVENGIFSVRKADVVVVAGEKVSLLGV